jgi:hypothetical protein
MTAALPKFGSPINEALSLVDVLKLLSIAIYRYEDHCLRFLGRSISAYLGKSAPAFRVYSVIPYLFSVFRGNQGIETGTIAASIDSVHLHRPIDRQVRLQDILSYLQSDVDWILPFPFLLHWAVARDISKG